MTKGDRDNMNERIHREYRYHPEEFRRQHLKYGALLTIPCIFTGVSITYYYITGKPIWKADLQHILNILRSIDTSPRSRLYAYQLEEMESLPVHLIAYREQNIEQRRYADRVFNATHSAFQRPDIDVLRRLELELALEAEAAEEAE